VARSSRAKSPAVKKAAPQKKAGRKRPGRAGKAKPADIDAYLVARSPEIQAVASEVRRMMKAFVPGVRESINPWGVPTFGNDKGDFAFFLAASAHVSLGFARGTSLSDPQKLLEGTGKNLRHVKLRSPADLQREGVRSLIVEAAALGAPVMGSRK